jgi:hypothetical protein
VGDILARIRPMVETKAAANRTKIAERIEPDLPQVFADAEKAGRVLLNLAVNAIKFSPAGETVEIWARRGEPGEIEIGVTDRGPGISAENLALIFDRFKQVPEGRSHIKGFGLGLNIARELAALNLGEMRVASRLGEGSSFWFTLPINETENILTRLGTHIAAAEAPPGQLALLSVRPEGRACVSDSLRGFLSSVAHPGDLIHTGPEASSLVLFGHTTRPQRWVERLREAAASIARGSPGQNRCAFAVELLGAWPYPEDQALAMAAALEQTTGVLGNA